MISRKVFKSHQKILCKTLETCMYSLPFLRRAAVTYQIFKEAYDSKWFLKISTGLEVYPDDFCHSSGQQSGLKSNLRIKWEISKLQNGNYPSSNLNRIQNFSNLGSFCFLSENTFCMRIKSDKKVIDVFLRNLYLISTLGIHTFCKVPAQV